MRFSLQKYRELLSFQLAKQKKRIKVFPSCMSRRQTGFLFLWLRHMCFYDLVSLFIQLQTCPPLHPNWWAQEVSVNRNQKLFLKPTLKPTTCPFRLLPRCPFQFQLYLTKATFFIFCISFSKKKSFSSTCKNKIKCWFLISLFCHKDCTLWENNISN